MLVREILPHSNTGIILLDGKENDFFAEKRNDNFLIFCIQFKKQNAVSIRIPYNLMSN